MTMTTDNRSSFNIGADSIAVHYRQWKGENGRIYALFVRFAEELVAAGRSRYSADALGHRVRWHVQIEWKEEYKINNNHIALIARDLMSTGVVPDGFFECRRRRAR